MKKILMTAVVVLFAVGSVFAAPKNRMSLRQSVFSTRMSLQNMHQETELEILLSPFYQLSTMPLLDLNNPVTGFTKGICYYGSKADNQGSFEFLARITSALITGFYPQTYENIARNKQVLKEIRKEIEPK